MEKLNLFQEVADRSHFNGYDYIDLKSFTVMPGLMDMNMFILVGNINLKVWSRKKIRIVQLLLFQIQSVKVERETVAILAAKHAVITLLLMPGLMDMLLLDKLVIAVLLLLR